MGASEAKPSRVARGRTGVRGRQPGRAEDGQPTQPARCQKTDRPPRGAGTPPPPYMTLRVFVSGFFLGIFFCCGRVWFAVRCSPRGERLLRGRAGAC